MEIRIKKAEEDHPRIRGEHCHRSRVAPPIWGSSPHTRGAPAAAPPAPTTSRDHPRIRGEHVGAIHLHRMLAGSSPHTRGALERCRAGRDPGRIIPAYAGSTADFHGHRRYRRDHPRIRGEHCSRSRRPRRAVGSSPHTRGAPLPSPVPTPSAGIIPAYAGSTCKSRGRSSSWSDHPRIRGEHVFRSFGSKCPKGSSPHTRGAPDRGVQVIEHTPDHPRIRGEHARRRAARPEGEGSSPHTRGAHPKTVRGLHRERIIPAYAGSTPSASPPPAPRRDHPRIRGEHYEINRIRHDGLGSSPHTRGAQKPSASSRRHRRIIPAYAGSTRPRL